MHPAGDECGFLRAQRGTSKIRGTYADSAPSNLLERALPGRVANDAPAQDRVLTVAARTCASTNTPPAEPIGHRQLDAGPEIPVQLPRQGVAVLADALTGRHAAHQSNYNASAGFPVESTLKTRPAGFGHHRQQRPDDMRHQGPQFRIGRQQPR